ncbi:MAG: hypothetical protein EA342_04760 [Leptolyngbya sp. LCM1.Bin17]|nr:MAG: hypothetical protein EA342_04760 [Leptolyngbya sp. LCM1.Bin17]
MTGLVCAGRTIVTRLQGDVNLAKGAAIRYSNLASNEPLRVSAIPTVIACALQHRMPFLHLWIVEIHRLGPNPDGLASACGKASNFCGKLCGNRDQNKKNIKFWGQFKHFYIFINPDPTLD